MEKEYVMQVAQIIKEQLVALTPMTVLMSWSIEEFAATLYRDLPALRIKVNGRPARAIWIFQRAAARQTPVAFWLQGSYETVKAKRLTPRLRR